jgi:hypothetical protein
MARKKLWFLFLHGKNPTQKAPLSWPNLNLITCKVLIFKYHHIVNQGFGIWIRRHSLVSWRWCTRWSRTSRIQTQEMPVESGMGVERRHCSQHQKSCYKTLGRSLQVASSIPILLKACLGGCCARIPFLERVEMDSLRDLISYKSYSLWSVMND